MPFARNREQIGDRVVGGRISNYYSVFFDATIVAVWECHTVLLRCSVKRVLAFCFEFLRSDLSKFTLSRSFCCWEVLKVLHSFSRALLLFTVSKLCAPKKKMIYSRLLGSARVSLSSQLCGLFSGDVVAFTSFFWLFFLFPRLS